MFIFVLEEPAQPLGYFQTEDAVSYSQDVTYKGINLAQYLGMGGTHKLIICAGYLSWNHKQHVLHDTLHCVIFLLRIN